MNIKGVNPNNIINAYNTNKSKVMHKEENNKPNDRIEISKLGKTLNNYSMEEGTIDNSEKVAKLQREINNGTYNIDARLTAKSILDKIRESKL